MSDLSQHSIEWQCAACGELAEIACEHFVLCERCATLHQAASPPCLAAFRRARYAVYESYRVVEQLRADILPIRVRAFELGRDFVCSFETEARSIYAEAGWPYGEDEADFRRWLKDSHGVESARVM
jgi:hypothetical protein